MWCHRPRRSLNGFPHARAVQQCLEKRTVQGKDPTGKLGGLVSRSTTVLAGCCWTNDLHLMSQFSQPQNEENTFFPKL